MVKALLKKMSINVNKIYKYIYLSKFRFYELRSLKNQIQYYTIGLFIFSSHRI